MKARDVCANERFEHVFVGSRSVIIRDGQAKSDKFLCFVAIVKSFDDRRATAAAHPFRCTRMIQHPSDGPRQLLRISGREQEASLRVAKERADRRQIACNYRQAAGPVFEDFHGNVQKKLRRGAERTHPDARLTQGRRHLFVTNSSLNLDAGIKIESTNSPAKSIFGCGVIEVSDKKHAYAEALARKCGCRIEKQERAGSFG